MLIKLAKYSCFIVLFFTAPWVHGFDWITSNVQLLHGGNFELGDKDRTTVTVEHANGWKYGKNFFFVDVLNRRDIGVEVYDAVY